MTTRACAVAALVALGAIGPAAKAALPNLVEALKILHLETQIQAYLAIRQITADDPDSVNDILVTVTSHSAQRAVPARPNPAVIVKQLIQVLQGDPNPQARARWRRWR